VIPYLDSSALVKCYVAESGSDDVLRIVSEASVAGTSLIARSEISAALSKAVRLKLLTRNAATAALQVFRSQWLDIVRIQLTEALVADADALAWTHALRGYDAVHLASAIFWQDTVGEPVTVVTFDRQLWDGARRSNLAVFPVAWPASQQ
jgi:predicted nucleic acid-binding protein